MNTKQAYLSSQMNEINPPAFCRIFSTAVAGLFTFAMALSAICVLVALALIGYSIVVRYFVGQPSLWIDEVVGFLVVGIVMFGAACALREGRHIGVDLVTEMMSPRWQRWTQVWSMSVVLVLSVFLIVNGWQTAMFSKSIGMVTQGYLELPMYQLQLLIPLGGFLLALAAIDSLLRLACGASAFVAHEEEKH
ncbi:MULTISPECIES: TRAP transporter small permease [Pseudomonadaceae]|uniref:TRAP transporter small permease n=1 Tax=Pseudomonadaceae TaxID=135621 RepID=UPI00104067D9|nr:MULTISPECIES: TRAP transporter small permease [Pseudomonadaceae]MBA1279595.1 TRAP transporter small permease [Stutzerimonas stutzeri]MBC8649571.1 TRAP transporter small permease [Pseudomonas sp. MT4]QXY90898.1 TRAP transporter small permease [Pseudomonas sp. MTM4]TCD19099.1 TRAP transporter small permease [Pseudomonas sp. IC_126]